MRSYAAEDFHSATLATCQPGKSRTVTPTIKRGQDPHAPVRRMRQRIDSEAGRRRYNRRAATAEPVFANIGHKKRLDRFSPCGREKMSTQSTLLCLVHNIENLGGHVG